MALVRRRANADSGVEPLSQILDTLAADVDHLATLRGKLLESAQVVRRGQAAIVDSLKLLQRVKERSYHHYQQDKEELAGRARREGILKPPLIAQYACTTKQCHLREL